MKEHITWIGMAVTTVVGLLAGWAIGDLTRRYRHGVQRIEELQRRLPSSSCPAASELRRMRGELNDIHKMVRAVSEGLGKRPS